MPYLQYRDQRVTLTATDQAVGAFEGAALRVPGDDPRARAVVRLASDGTGVISRGSADAVVLVNGVQLGPEPSPLLHGDKVELGGHQLHYGDDAKAGSTQFVSAAALAEQVRAASGAPRKPTSATGGRLVSLVDGREYAVGDAGVSFGREIGNDIVVPSGEVSRRHATIAPSEGGYVLTDLSTNGVLINGIRVSQRQILSRGDVIRIGGEEFRFYADKAKDAAAGVPPSAPAAAPVAPAPAPAAAPPPPVAAAAAPQAPPPEVPMVLPTDPTIRARPPVQEPDTVPTPPAPPAQVPPPAPPVAAAPAPPAQVPPPAPPAPAPPVAQPVAQPVAAAPPPPVAPEPVVAARTPLASLVVINEGPMKGKRFEIFTPLANVGRGAHNDIQLTNDSVSDSHAKILRKEGHWYVVDQGSTNGTYVGGRRVQGEQQLVGAPDVRFGDIKVTFRPAAGLQDEGTGTRAVSVEAVRRMSTHRQQAAAPASAPPAAAKPDKPIVIPEIPVPEKKKGCAAAIAFAVALAAAGAGVIATILIIARG